MNRYIMIRRLRGPAFLLLIGVLALLHQMATSLSFWRRSGRWCSFWSACIMLAERAALAADGGYPPMLRPRRAPGPNRSQGRIPAFHPIPASRQPTSALTHEDYKDPSKEDNHEQRTSHHTPRRRAAPVSALRSQDPVARLPRAAEGRLARPARCLEGPALRHEGQLCGTPTVPAFPPSSAPSS